MQQESMKEPGQEVAGLADATALRMAAMAGQAVSTFKPAGSSAGAAQAAHPVALPGQRPAFRIAAARSEAFHKTWVDRRAL